MNEQICAIFESKKLILKDLKRLETSKFSRSKTLEIFLGVDLKGYYTLVFIRNAKTRFLKKDSDALNEICANIEKSYDFNIKKRVLFYKSEICSKAIKALESGDWRCYDFV
ncbi:hypothetical protein [Campylobacter mucosalis]|uniref:Uncharacterized protein n=1 Tax=Campylobacter mucosalis CCUG 21559 TaxID=1032067 RepID=A0A6G5QGH2_9BACT|nr:hypothetical protein [Campylobacter mucosalis]QCD44741.1 hypothetical protein CMUC_0952 [Campylobacter mucosalis CCUG 21559]